MELVSPISMIYVYLKAPAMEYRSIPPIHHPSTLLVALWTVHYVNRAIISPLRTPSRSQSHITIPLAAVAFNLINGGLNGYWLSSGTIKADGWNTAAFWASIGLFAFGLIGNAVHDEVLIDIRKDAQESKETSQDEKPKYGIPRGFLYRFIS